MELWQYDATDLAHLIRTGQASGAEAVDSVSAACTRSIPPSMPWCACWRTRPVPRPRPPTPPRARGIALPPLHGVPVTTKINVDQAGLPTDTRRRPAQGPDRTGRQPGRRQFEACRRNHRRPYQCAGLFDAHLLRQRPARPHAQSARSHRDAGGSSGGAVRRRRPGSAPSPMATTSAAQCASRPIATAWWPANGLRPHPAFNPTGVASGRPIGAILMATQGPHTRTVRDARLALEVMARGDRRDWRWNDVPMRGPAPRAPSRSRSCPKCPAARAIRRRSRRCGWPASISAAPATSWRKCCRPTSSAASSSGTRSVSPTCSAASGP